MENCLFQVGEPFIIKETAMKRLQSFLYLFDKTRDKLTNRDKINFQ